MIELCYYFVNVVYIFNSGKDRSITYQIFCSICEIISLHLYIHAFHPQKHHKLKISFFLIYIFMSCAYYAMVVENVIIVQ